MHYHVDGIGSGYEELKLRKETANTALLATVSRKCYLIFQRWSSRSYHFEIRMSTLPDKATTLETLQVLLSALFLSISGFQQTLTSNPTVRCSVRMYLLEFG